MSRVGDHARELHADALTWPPDAADMTWTPVNVAAALDAELERLLTPEGRRRLEDAFGDGAADA